MNIRFDLLGASGLGKTVISCEKYATVGVLFLPGQPGVPKRPLHEGTQSGNNIVLVEVLKNREIFLL
jgi:hypothetical protein